MWCWDVWIDPPLPSPLPLSPPPSPPPPSPSQWRQSGGYPSPGSQRHQAQDRNSFPSGPGVLLSRLKAAEGAMGSGEFYDRLEPLDPKDRAERSPLEFMSSASSQGFAFPWRDMERGREYTSLDRKGMNR